MVASNRKDADGDGDAHELKRQPQVYIERYQRLARNIIDLFLEIKQRSKALKPSESVKTPEQEHQSVKHKDPVVVLDYVRTAVRLLLADMEAHQQELRKRTTATEADLIQKVDELTEKTELLEKSEAAAVRKAEAMEVKLAQAEADVAKSLEENTKRMQHSEEEKKELQAQLQVLKDEAQMLNNWNSDNLRKLQDQQTQLEKFEQIKTKMALQQQKQQAQQQRVAKAQIRKMEAHEKGLHRIGDVEAQNHALSLQVTSLKEKLKALLNDKRYRENEDLQKTVQKLQERVQNHEATLRGKDEKIKRLTLQFEELKKNHQVTKQEHNRVYMELKKATTEQATTQAAGPDVAPVNAHLVEKWKEKLANREEEIGRLNQKMRNFLILEKKMDIQKRAFAEERSRYEFELNEWRTKLTQANEKIDRLGRVAPTPAMHLRDATMTGQVVDAPDSTMHSTGNARMSMTQSMQRSTSVGTIRVNRPRSAVTGRELPKSQLQASFASHSSSAVNSLAKNSSAHRGLTIVT